jgi:hypothetical protein
MGVIVGRGEEGGSVAVGGADVGVAVGGAEVSVDWMEAGVGFVVENKPHASNASDVRTRQVVLGGLLFGMKIFL